MQKQSGNIITTVGAAFSRLSFRAKLTIFFSIIAVVSVSIIALYNYQNTRSQLTQSLTSNLQNTAQIQAAAIGDLLTRQTNLLQSLGTSEAIRIQLLNCNIIHCGDPQVQTNFGSLQTEWQAANAAHNDNDPLVQAVLNNSAALEINVFRESFPDNLEVFATDQYGLVIAASNRTTKYSYANEPWWQAAYNHGKGGIYIAKPELIPNLSNYGIVIAVPVYASGTTQVIGVLRSTVRLIAARDLLASAQIGKTGEADLLFNGGDVLNPLGVLEQWPVSIVNQLNKMPENETIQMPLHQNLPHLVSQAQVSSSDINIGPAISSLKWRIVVSLEPSEAFAPINTAALANILISLGVLAIAIALSFGAASYLAIPINQLTDTARKVLSGNLQARANVTSRDEFGVLAETFNRTTSQLSDQIENLELRVSERTQELEDQVLRVRVAAEIARDISSALNLNELLTRSSELIIDRFKFYHAGIFLLDDKKEYAVLRASPTEAGKQLIANSHRLRVGEQGIVGRVAASGEARIALDTGADAVYFNNPFLPTTRSEMALPLRTRGEVFGVLDIQSEQPQAFIQEDIEILQVLADQLAIAIERINLNQQVQDQLKEIEQTYQEFTQRSWQGFARNKARNTGYKFDGIQLQPITAAPNYAGNISETQSDESEAIIPIRLRGQVIGYVNLRSRGNTISKETVSIVEQITERLASGLESARLTEETRERAQRERAIAEVSTKISAYSDTDSIMRAAVEELGRRLGGSTEVTFELSNNGQE